MPLYELPDQGREPIRVVTTDETAARRLADDWRALRPARQPPSEPAPTLPRTRRWTTVLLWLATVVALIVTWRLTDSPWAAGGVALIAAVAFVVLDISRGAVGGEPFATYDSLVAASIERRPARVLELASRWAERAGRSPPALMAFDVDLRVAAALWLLGQDADAEARIERHRSTDGGSREREYWSRRGSALCSAGLVDRGLEALDRAAAVAPRRATELFDKALWLARFGRYAEARERLDEARRLPSSFVSWAAGPLVFGIVALGEGRCADAERDLARAVRRMAWLPIGALRRAFDAEIAANRCLAAAGRGDAHAARRHLEQAAPFLEASGDLQLLVRCHRAVASP